MLHSVQHARLFFRYIETENPEMRNRKIHKEITLDASLEIYDPSRVIS